MLNKYYQRFFHPLVCILLAIMGCLLGFSKPREQRLIGFTIAIGAIFLYYITLPFFDLLAEKGVILPVIASARKDLLAPVMAENVYYFKGIPLAEYGLPSSDILVENTAKYFKEYDCVLMANHGVIIGSKTLKDAYLKLELAEQYAQVVLNTYILGGPKPLTETETQDILALRN